MRTLIVLALLNICSLLVAGDAPFAVWRDQVQVREALPAAAEHTIHAYFNTCPESPDGRWVLYYASKDVDADSGELRVLERATGMVTTLAHITKVEDAHRAACQQWVDGGRSIAYHDCRDGRWLVAAVDLATGKERIIAHDRQLGFGSPTLALLPLYGCHWNPGEHRDLELTDVRSGNIVSSVRIADVVTAHQAWIENIFSTTEGLSVFFPVLSPDGSKVFFKVAKGRGGIDFRGMSASRRDGKIVWDLTNEKPLCRFDFWGHPSWAPNSAGIFEKGNVLTTLADQQSQRFAKGSPSDHPSLSPDATLFVTDADLTKREGVAGVWGVIVGNASAEGYAIIHRFVNNQGTTSWRRSHPHPVFSADGRRIYFNVSAGSWTRLHVAEVMDQ
jgi:Tol biopolymer transport system component